MTKWISFAAFAVAFTGLGMQIERMTDQPPVIIYCQPVCEMPK